MPSSLLAPPARSSGYMNDPKPHRPGDLILDHYMPNATEEQREEARANLKAYVAAVIAIHQRLQREAGDNQTRAIPRVDVKSGTHSPNLQI